MLKIDQTVRIKVTNQVTKVTNISIDRFGVLYTLKGCIELYPECELAPVCSLLSDEERAYISSVVAPFRNEVITVTKHHSYWANSAYIIFDMSTPHYNFAIYLTFDYEGMEDGKPYTLFDLGV